MDKFPILSLRKPVLLFCSLLLALPAAAQTADEILAKYFAARGGLDKIKAIQSERVTGTIYFGPGADGPFLVERARPLKMHTEVNLNGQVVIRVYDGKSSGWVHNPFVPNPSVQPMSQDDLRNILDEADFEGPFVDYKSKGNRIEFAGKDEVEGKPAYKIKLTNRNGIVSYFSFDASSGLLLRYVGTRQLEGKDVPWESYFRDYREVAGVKYPFVIESSAPGTDQIQKITAEKIEVNIHIDESHFGKPTAPPPPPAATQPAAQAKPE
jgi:hypothetical protein